MPKALILISCSDEKSSYQESFFEKQLVTKYFPPPLYSKLLQKRKKVKKFIQSEQVYDLIIKGENRSERESNRMLCDGQDFDGTENEPGYLPAYKRYYYEEAKNLGYEILILSGLYGFVTPFDSIQNYNCHITDTIMKESSSDESITLQSFWKDTLTELIINFIKSQKIYYIVDLLSEESYQNTIDWYNIKQVEVRHRIFRNRAGSSILSNLRKFFINDILKRNPDELLKLLKPGYPLNRDYFEDDQIAFEDKIGIEQGYARESLKFDKNLYSFLGKKLNNLPESDKNALRLAEELYEKFENSEYKRQIATAFIQTYWGLLENKRKRLLKTLVDTYRKSGHKTRNVKIILKYKTKIKEFSFEDLEKKIINKDCKHFQAYDTEFLFKHALDQGKSSSYFGRFIKDKFGEEQIKTFIESYDKLRRERNIYKAIPQQHEKDIRDIKKDLSRFRESFLSKDESPMIILEKFYKRLSYSL